MNPLFHVAFLSMLFLAFTAFRWEGEREQN
jgi:hypothetical protein